MYYMIYVYQAQDNIKYILKLAMFIYDVTITIEGKGVYVFINS